MGIQYSCVNLAFGSVHKITLAASFPSSFHENLFTDHAVFYVHARFLIKIINVLICNGLLNSKHFNIQPSIIVPISKIENIPMDVNSTVIGPALNKSLKHKLHTIEFIFKNPTIASISIVRFYLHAPI